MVKEGNRQGNVLESTAGNDDAESAEVRSIEIPDTLSVKQLSDILSISGIEVIKHLMRNGIMANVNQAIDYDSAAAVVTALGYQPQRGKKAARKSLSKARQEQKQRLEQGASAGLKPRPPVVTVMGHVNHGKTRLLDAIRKTKVMESEAGGITQHIGAYQVEIDGHKITFLDTPGHEAFTAMRAHGAQVTDIAILVVAVDDGVMPQTREAIEHAQAAGVPIVVAANKIDIPDANLELVKQQLADAKLLVEEWGGDAVLVPVSAKENQGIAELLENLLLVAEMEDLKANPAKPAEGVVIEAEMDSTKGPLATILINDGTLRTGDTVVVGNTWGRLKAMYNDAGKQVRRAEPSTPVEILGLNEVPREGDTLMAVVDERRAKAVLEKRKKEEQATPVAAQAVNLSNLFEQVSAGRIKELNIILETDVQGSIEPIRNSLEQLSMDEVKVRIIRSGSGNITESDVMLAAASTGLIIGFNTEVEPGARKLAELEGVSIRNYDVIYSLLDDVGKALKGMLEPTLVEVSEGRAEVREVFSAPKKQKIAGVYITEGKARRGVSVRLRRKDEIIIEAALGSLRRFKDDVTEVATGYECGIALEGVNDYQVGDTMEFFRIDTVQ